MTCALYTDTHTPYARIPGALVKELEALPVIDHKVTLEAVSHPSSRDWATATGKSMRSYLHRAGFDHVGDEDCSKRVVWVPRTS
jgi:hypothetical protein